MSRCIQFAWIMYTIACMWPTQVHPRITMIAFDLEGVLVQTDRKGIACHLIRQHPISFISEAIRDSVQGCNPKDDAFTYMDTVYPKKHTTHTTWDPKGNPVPALMHDWLAGIPECDSNKVLTWLSQQVDNDTLLSTSRKHVYMSVFQAIFDPHVRGENTILLPEGYDLLQHLKRHTHCELAVLSNYDTMCFNYIRNAPHTRDLFRHFPSDNVHISSNMKRIKPDPQIYYDLCAHHNIAPHECLFIDDQYINVEAARNAGLHAVHFDENNIETVYDYINQYLKA